MRATDRKARIHLKGPGCRPGRGAVKAAAELTPGTPAKEPGRATGQGGRAIPEWLQTLLAIVGGAGGLIGAVGGLSAHVAWRKFKHQQPIESQDAVFKSIERQIASAEKRGDKEEVERLRKELEQQEEVRRAQQGVRSRVPINMDQDKLRLTGEEAKILRKQLAAARRMISLTARDFFYQGNGYSTIGEHERALEAYDRAVALKRDLAAAHYNRGITLGKLERWTEALSASDRAIELNPDDASAHLNQGIALASLERWEEALASLDRAARLTSEKARVFGIRGVVLAKLGRFEASLADLDRALVIDGSFIPPVYNKARVWSQMKRGEEALDCLKHAIQVGATQRVDAKTDPTFAFLRNHPDYGARFWELVREEEKAKPSEGEEKPEEPGPSEGKD